MKAFVLFIFLIVSVSAFSQSQNLHMIEMSTNNTLLGAFNYGESGGGGSAKRYDSTAFLGGNYAYKISPRVQLGVQGNYLYSDDFEAYRALVGGIYNFDDDLTNAFYTSLYAGMSWSHFYISNLTSDKHNEEAIGRLSLGKRFALSNLNLPNVTYSPEISITREQSTRGDDTHTNTVSIRFLQFSVFF